MSLTPDEFASLDDGDKLTVLYSQLAHLRRNVLAASEGTADMLRKHTEAHGELRDRVTRIEVRMQVAGVLVMLVLGVALTALVKALGI